MYKVFIDAGHGLPDPGAISCNGKYKEADNCLQIIRHIHGREPQLKEIQFGYSRLGSERLAGDSLTDLWARVDAANKWGADIFISIHQNADVNRKGRGLETYYFGDSNGHSVTGCKLAECIHGPLIASTKLTDRGVKPARFLILRETKMPAALVECGFVGGDPEEAARVSAKEFHTAAAMGIMQGIKNYFGIQEDKNVGYSDVKPGTWYAGPIEFCNQKGLMGGYPDGTFKPNQGVSRAEMASLTARLYMLTAEEERAMKVWNDCAESVVVVRAQASGGSGFFINNDTIVTNAHVVNGVNQVTISTKNNGDFIGEVQRRGAVWDDKGIPQAIGSNKLIDLATIKLVKKADDKAVWGDGFKPVKFATECPREMSFLVIIGNPLLIEFWGSYGVVSRLTDYFIDTDAAINPGNSGGAAFNLDGEFVGVPTQKYTGAEIDNMGNIIRFDAVKLWLEGKTDQIQF